MKQMIESYSDLDGECKYHISIIFLYITLDISLVEDSG